MTADLRKNTVRAVGASTAANALAKLLSLISTLILARLLSPEDFGLMAIATSAMGFVAFFNEIGLGAAIVQRQQVSEAELDGCFGVALLASSGLALLVAVISTPVAIFFDLPALQPVFLVLGFGFFFGALDTVPMALLRKDMRFQTLVWRGVLGTALQALVAIPLAWAGWKHWALVAAFFVGQAVSTIGYWHAVDWRPRRPWRLGAGRALMGYGLNVTFTRVLWHAYMNADKLILGRLLGQRAVGLYDMGKSLATLPTAQIAGLITSIASPVFASLQEQPERLRSVLLRLTRGLAYLCFPALTGMALVGEDLVRVTLGETWMEAVLPLQALCLSELVRALASLQSQLLISTGRVQVLTRYSAAMALLLPLALALGAWRWGMTGVALAWLLAYPALSFWLVREALRGVGLSLAHYFAALRQPLTGCLLMALALFGLAAILPSDWSAGTRLAVQVLFGALVYGGYVLLLDRDGPQELRQVLNDVGLPAAWLERGPWRRSQTETPAETRPGAGPESRP